MKVKSGPSDERITKKKKDSLLVELKVFGRTAGISLLDQKRN